MRIYPLFVCGALILMGACATIKNPTALKDTAVTATENNAGAIHQPEPTYVAPFNWRVAQAAGTPKGGVIANVTLIRPELAGNMTLSIILSGGLTPLARAEQESDQLSDSMLDVLVSEAAESLTDPPEASFNWKGPSPSNPDVERMSGKVIFRQIPGHPELLAMCQGWWPESSHEFLISPLHRACESVRLSD